MDIFDVLSHGKDISPITGCWIWKWGKTTEGYGEIFFNGKTQYVHRVSAFIYLNFDLDPWKSVCHKCNNPSCFNPEHLYIGDDKTNGEDRAKKITHCKHGHALIPGNVYYAKNSKYPKRQCRRCKANREYDRRRRLGKVKGNK